MADGWMNRKRLPPADACVGKAIDEATRFGAKIARAMAAG